MTITTVLDGVLDRSVLLGYSRLGSRVRRLWWPAGPGPKAMAGKRVVVTGAMVIEEVCDISDLDAVRSWSDHLSGRVDALHGLVHNAGAMPKERIETRQSHESQLATHVLGPHLMTERLLPLLRNAGRLGGVHVVG